MQKRPFNKNQVQVLRKMLAENPRDFALLNTGIDTSLRSIDLLHLKVQDIRTAWGEIREQIEVKQKKTGNRVQCLLSQNSQEALERWIQVSNKEDSDYLFTPMRGGNKPMSTVNYRKLVDKWCERCGWDSKYFGTHSIRRTLPSVIYGATKDLRSCQLILGHRSVSNTALYLGVQQEDAFEQVRKHRI